jgi:hypothetical protein
MAKTNKRVVPTLAVCEEASDMLKAAGFELVAVSRHSEARYFRWPGKPGLLRVATHAGRKMCGLEHVLASATFPPYLGTKVDKPDHTIINPDKVKTVVAVAIGLYFLSTRDTSKPTWRGPNPLNDDPRSRKPATGVTASRSRTR